MTQPLMPDMPNDFQDTPTAEGATNVALHQRAATAPFARQVVNIQGDENAGRAIGFSATGILTALEIDENPFAVVDTEAQFDAALAAGRSMVLRGEGVGGIIPLTTQKVINASHTTIKSDAGAVLRFGALTGHANPRAITVHADDVTLSNFELTSSITDLATNPCYGLVFHEGIENPSTPGLWGHRMKVLDLTIHNWQRCISKDGSELTTPHQDVLIDRCFIHTAKEMCVQVNYGFHRLVMRDCRVMSRLTWNPATVTHNCVIGGSNWRDCLVENCYFANTYRHAFEATTANELLYYNERTRVVLCRAENCGDMAFSLGFCRGGIFSHCSVKNAIQAGFEVGGRVAGHPAAGTNPSYFAQAIIDSCEVDGITHTGPSYGFTLDGAGDTIVRGACKISNITSTYESSPGANDGACGIGLTDCERCSIQGVVFNDAGHKHIYCDAVYLPHTTGFHDFSNNTFYNRNSASAFVQYALWLRNQSCSVRQNLAYQKLGTSLLYLSNTASTASLVCADGVPCAVGTVLFGGAPPATNLILNG